MFCRVLFPVLQVSWNFSNPPRVLDLDDRQGLIASSAMQKKKVPERPSLFSTSGSSSFNPFSAALSSLRPEERAEVNRTGVSDALQRYANQEMQRLFETI